MTIAITPQISPQAIQYLAAKQLARAKTCPNTARNLDRGELMQWATDRAIAQARQLTPAQADRLEADTQVALRRIQTVLTHD